MGQLGDLSPEGSVAVGILVGLLSTCIQSLGLTLQRKSHLLEDARSDIPPSLHRPPYRRRRWQIGMLLFVISNIVGSSIQITTLPLPVLSTLQASGLVFNSLLATLILHEPFTRYSLVGTVLVCAGAVLIATFGAIAEPAHSLNQLLSLLGERQFILWMVATFLLVFLIIVSTKTLRYLRPRWHHTSRARLLRGMAYGAVSGILSAHSLLVAKSAVELLVRTIVDRNNQFKRWQSWMILLGLLALALTQLYYLHKGLKLCSTSVLYPFVFCIYNIVAILDGLIYFRQASRLSVLHGCLIALGTMILLAGVFALSWRLSSAAGEEGSGMGEGRHRRPTITQSPLAPGLGFPEPTSSTDTSRTGSPDLLEDEESPFLSRRKQNGKLPSPFSFHSSHRRRSSASTPSSRKPSRYGTLNHHHPHQDYDTTAEIFSELQDEDLPPWSPTSYRSSSKTLRPSNSTQSTRSPRRVSFNRLDDNRDHDSPPADESSSLLSPTVHRSSTGRTYVNKPKSITRAGDRRRKSVTFSERLLDNHPDNHPDDDADADADADGLGRNKRRRKSSAGASPSTNTTVGLQSGRSRRRGRARATSQDATGGWWKLRRWWSGDRRQEEASGRAEAEEDEEEEE